jgi:hypothetical protein
MNPNLHGAANDQEFKWRLTRWKGRTDLKFLCQHILGFKDVCYFHDPLIKMLQPFPVPTGPIKDWLQWDAAYFRQNQ